MRVVRDVVARLYTGLCDCTSPGEQSVVKLCTIHDPSDERQPRAIENFFHSALNLPNREECIFRRI